MTYMNTGVKVEGRLVPFPVSISEEARTALQRLVGENGTPLHSLRAMPAPDDHDAWVRMRTAVDAQYAAMLPEAADGSTRRIGTITSGDVTIHVATPKKMEHPDCAYVDLHGGALTFGGGAACRAAAQVQADRHGVVCYGVDYRMPPEHPFPAALDDCVNTYRRLLGRYRPENVVIGGRSAGGNLAAAMVLKAREAGLPLPAALVLLSPEVDLTESGDSFEVNRMVDVVLPGSLMANSLLYADGVDLAHPHVSPLFGDLSGFPPTFLQSGTRDLFLSNAVRMHRWLRSVGVPAELHVFEGMPHGGFMGGTPEDEDLAQETARFVRERWAA